MPSARKRTTTLTIRAMFFLISLVFLSGADFSLSQSCPVSQQPPPATDLEAVRNIQAQISVHASLIEPAWQTVPTVLSMCFLPGIECIDCEIVRIDTGQFWLDQDEQGAWNIGDGTLAGLGPLWGTIGRLSILELVVSPTTTGSVTLAALLPSEISQFSIAVRPLLATNSLIDGVVPRQLFDDSFFTSLIGVALSGLAEVTGTAQSVFGACIDRTMISLTLLNLPNFAVDQTLCWDQKINVLQIFDVPIGEITTSSLCNVQRADFLLVVRTSIAEPLPQCFWDACEADTDAGLILRAFVENGVCFLGQPLAADVDVAGIVDPFPGNSGTTGRLSANERCAVTRDNTDCIDCNGAEDVEMDGPLLDVCGICGGDGESCRDCFRLPNGTSTYDQCDVCGGDDTECQDCSGVVNGDAFYDRCDVCITLANAEQGETSAWTAATYHLARAHMISAEFAGAPANASIASTSPLARLKSTSAEYATAATTADPARRKTGTCAVFAEATEPAASTARANVNGTLAYDLCGVCDGLNDTCQDCAAMPLGTQVYDACGLCGGLNDTCTGCDGVLLSGLVYDMCGICGGSDECVDCAGVICGLSTYDACDVCDGDGQSCRDCSGQPFGNKTLNRCHQCVPPELVDGNDNCVEELLAADLHHKLSSYGWIIVGLIALSFLISALCAATLGRSVIGAWLAPSPPASAPGSGTKRGCKTKSRVVFGKPVSPGTDVSKLLLICAVLATLGVTQAQETSKERLYVGICAETNLGQLEPSLCQLPIADPCEVWVAAGSANLVECHRQDPNSVVRRLHITGFELTGEISGDTFSQLRFADEIVIFGNRSLESAESLSIESFGVSQFSNLRQLWLDSVKLAQFPSDVLAASKKLESIKIIDSGAEGDGLGNLLCSLPNLRTLVVRGSLLTGSPFCQPSILYDQLEVLDLRNNQFSGTIPSFGASSQLQEIYLDNNEFTEFESGGLDVADYPATLRILCLAYNELEGQFVGGAGWRTQPTALEELYVDGNRLDGLLPSMAIGEPSTFVALGISFNRFSGAIPNSYTDDNRVYKTFRVDNNQIEGPFPDLEPETLCGECSFECNLYCLVGDTVPPEILTSQCSFSLERDACNNGCANQGLPGLHRGHFRDASLRRM